MIFLSPLSFIIPLLIGLACGCAAGFGGMTALNKRRANGGLSTKQTIIAGIQQNIGDFSEMFEPVYSVSVGKANKQEEVFAEWNAKVRDSAEDNGYKALFDKYFGGYATWGQGKKKVNVKKQNKIYKKKAEKLVKIFFKGNILRGSDVFETGCETTAERYDYVGEGSVETDKQYEVLAPVWMYQDTVVDKGVIR